MKEQGTNISSYGGGGAICSSNPVICTSVVTTETGFQSLRDEWDHLLDRSAQSVFFLRWHWNFTWWRYLAPSNSRLFLITCRDNEGRLIGLAPFYWHRHGVGRITYLNEILFLGTGKVIKTSEYVDIIAWRGYERSVAEAVASFLSQQSGWDRLWLWGIPAESSTLPHFQRELGIGAKVTLCDRSPYVSTEGDWETFQRGLGKAMRTSVSYKTRKLFKNHECVFRCIDSFEEFGAAMERFVSLHQARWQSKGKRGSFMQSRFEGFLTDVMKECLGENNLRLWILEVDKKTSAVLVGFLHNRVLHYFQSGFDPAYAKESIGLVMLGLCVRSCIEAEEIREFDFMGGGSAYKEHWTRSTRDAVELEVMRTGIGSRLFIVVRWMKDIAALLYRKILPLEARRKIRVFLGHH